MLGDIKVFTEDDYKNTLGKYRDWEIVFHGEAFFKKGEKVEKKVNRVVSVSNCNQNSKGIDVLYGWIKQLFPNEVKDLNLSSENRVESESEYLALNLYSKGSSFVFPMLKPTRKYTIGKPVENLKLTKWLPWLTSNYSGIKIKLNNRDRTIEISEGILSCLRCEKIKPKII